MSEAEPAAARYVRPGMRLGSLLLVAFGAALLAGCGQAPEPTAPARPRRP